jgi:5'-nucleotidase
VQTIFQGGNVGDLHQLLGVVNASTVLYIGDHIYGDVLRSKKSIGWRTMLIVPELQMELAHAGVAQRLRAS